MKAWPDSLLVCCGVLVCISCVTSTCVGNSCPEEHENAVAAGLLGSAVSAPSCSPKTYPKGDKLKPVSCFAATPCLTLPVTLDQQCKVCGFCQVTLDTRAVDIRWAGGADDSDKVPTHAKETAHSKTLILRISNKTVAL